MGKIRLSFKQWWLAAGVIIALSLAGIIFSSYALPSITLKQEMIQSKLDAKLPIEKEGALSKIVLEKASVDISGRQPLLYFKGYSELLKKRISVEAQTKGEIIYRHGKFYFHPQGLEIKNLSFAGFEIPENKRELVSAGVIAATSFYLNNSPVYTLKGTKGAIIKAAIKSIDFSDGAITVHLSIWQLTLTALIWLVALISGIVIATALVINPEAFGSLIALSVLAGD